MQDRLETRAKRRCRGCKQQRPKASFELLPTRTRNVLCVHCVATEQRKLERAAVWEQVRKSWEVTR